MLLVDLDLRKIGSVCEVAGDVLGDAIFDVHSHVAVQVVRDRRAGVEIARQVGDSVGLDLQILRTRRRLQAHDRGRQGRHVKRLLAPSSRHAHQKRKLVLPPVRAQGVEPPHLGPPRPVAQRLERQGGFRCPASFEPPDLHLPDGIPVAEVLSLIADLPVRAAANRVDRELDGISSIVERIEHEGDHGRRRSTRSSGRGASRSRSAAPAGFPSSGTTHRRAPGRRPATRRFSRLLPIRAAVPSAGSRKSAARSRREPRRGVRRYGAAR